MRSLALLGGIAAVIGLVITVLTFTVSRDQAVPPRSSGDAQVDSTGSTDPAEEFSPLQEVAALATGVQLWKFVELLGEPDRRREVLDSEFKSSIHNESIWERPSYVLQAVTDAQDTIVLYTVTTMDRNFHPELPLPIGKNGSSLRLGLSKFSDIEPSFIGLDAYYPANAKYSYSEAYGGGFAFQYRTFLFTQSWDATGIASFDSSLGEDSAFDDFNLVSGTCSGFEPCHTLPSNEATALQRLRASLVISGFTITEPDFDIESIIFTANPDILNSRCELPVGCN
jgi:hypothetical protein